MTESDFNPAPAASTGAANIYELLGTRFEFVTTHCGLAEQVRRLFERFLVASSGDSPHFTLVAVERTDHTNHFDLKRYGPTGRVNLREDAHFDRIVMSVITDFNSRAIRSTGLHAVHAGAVGYDGRVIAFPASSGAGKSTLVAACARVGFDYVSDEALCLEWDSGRVVPYAKPLWLSRWSLDAVGLGEQDLAFGSPKYREAIVLPEARGWTVASGPLSLSDVVLLEIGGGVPALSSLPQVKVADTLVRHAFSRRDARRLFQLVADQARGCRAWRLRFEDPLGAAELLAEAFARRETHRPPASTQ